MWRVWILVLLTVLLTSFAAPAHAQTGAAAPVQSEPCTLKPGGTHSVVGIVDADSFALDDGTIVRLAGTLAPSPPLFLKQETGWPPYDAARDALAALILHQSVEIAYRQKTIDRWGRLVAHAFRVGKGPREWVQGHQLRHGHARVDALPGSLDCLPELLAHERVGMTADAGLWSHPAYRVRWADAPQRLMRLRNTFQLVEGTVAKVAVTRSRIYLNFGTDWRSDFTAGAALKPKDVEPSAIATLQALEGKRVRIRGWIERRNGPYIELFHPSQVEALPDEALPPSSGVARGTVPPSGRDGEDAAPAEAASPASAATGIDL